MVLTTRLGKHFAKLTEAVAKGRRFENVEIVWVGSAGSSIRIRLKGAYVSSYHVNPPGGEKTSQETWSLTFDQITIDYGAGGS